MVALMPQTATLKRLDDPISAERSNLRQALANLKAEQQQLERLNGARERSREQSWVVSSKISDAQTELSRAQDNEPSRLARAFASGQQQGVPSPVDRAKSRLDEAEQEYQKIEEIEEALDAEIVTVNNNLDRRQAAVHAALAELVCVSPEFHSLFVELEQAWARLRGVRHAFQQIQHAMNGYMPEEFSAKWQASVSLAPGIIGVPTDNAPVQAWSVALARLLEDPDAALPDNV
jgi:chromosome segregation ATPase